jgi:transposase
MALGRQGERRSELMVGWAELPRSPGHAFYNRLQAILVEARFDNFAEKVCGPYYASRRGRPSLPPDRYFRMHLVGYFEGIDSERGLEWRCADSLSLREFLRLGTTEPVPDHSWLSRSRSRLPLEVHEAIFAWVLQRLAEHGLIRGERIGVDASTIEANAALRAIVRRDTGEGYREMLERLAKESGIATPTAEDLVRLDRQRQGKRLSNAEWASPTDPEARNRQAQGRAHASCLQARARGRSRHRRHRRSRDPLGRPGRHHDPAGDAEDSRGQSGGSRRGPDGGGPGRAGGRQGASLAGWPEGAGGRSLEEPDC